jgi:hypothetical protein
VSRLQGITARWRIPLPWPEVARATRVLVPSQAIPPGVKRYLLPDEKMVITIRRHPGQVAGHAGLLASACVAASVLTAVTDSAPLLLGAAWGACAIILLYFIARGIEWLYSYLVVTDVRLIVIRGPFVRRVITVPAREVHELTFHRSLLGRIIGYGTFTLRPVRQGYRMPDMNYIPYPVLLYREVAGLLSSDETDD